MSTTKRDRRTRRYARLRAKHGDQAYLHTPEWQAKEREADKAIARGELLGPYAVEKTIEELQRLAQGVGGRKKERRAR